MNFTAMLKSACIKGQDFVIQNTYGPFCVAMNSKYAHLYHINAVLTLISMIRLDWIIRTHTSVRTRSFNAGRLIPLLLIHLKVETGLLMVPGP